MIEMMVFIELLVWALEIISVWWPAIALIIGAGLLILIADGD